MRKGNLALGKGDEEGGSAHHSATDIKACGQGADKEMKIRAACPTCKMWVERESE